MWSDNDYRTYSLLCLLQALNDDQEIVATSVLHSVVAGVEEPVFLNHLASPMYWKDVTMADW